MPNKMIAFLITNTLLLSCLSANETKSYKDFQKESLKTLNTIERSLKDYRTCIQSASEAETANECNDRMVEFLSDKNSTMHSKDFLDWNNTYKSNFLKKLDDTIVGTHQIKKCLEDPKVTDKKSAYECSTKNKNPIL